MLESNLNFNEELYKNFYNIRNDNLKFLIKGILFYTKNSLNYIDYEYSHGFRNINKSLFDKVFIKNSRDSIEEVYELLLELSREDYILMEELESDILMYCNTLSEYLSDFSNTILFRQYTLSTGRKIDTINSKIPDSYKRRFKKVFEIYEKYFSNSYSYIYNRGSLDRVSGNLYYKNCGYIKDLPILEVVKEHSNSLTIQTIDISKFFNNVKLKRIYDLNVFKTFIDYAYPSSLYSENNSVELFGRILMSPNNVRSILINVLNLTLSFLTHNGVLPTGTPYSPVLSNIFMLSFDSSICNELEDVLSGSESKYVITRYVDDITISSSSIKDNYIYDFIIVKKIEEFLNSMGLYLKYEKTNIFNRLEQNANILGYSIPKISLGNEITVNSKFRKEIIDIIRNKNSLIFDRKELGKINYFLSSGSVSNMIDILLNFNIENRDISKDLIYKTRILNKSNNINEDFVITDDTYPLVLFDQNIICNFDYEIYKSDNYYKIILILKEEVECRFLSSKIDSPISIYLTKV